MTNLWLILCDELMGSHLWMSTATALASTGVVESRAAAPMATTGAVRV